MTYLSNALGDPNDLGYFATPTDLNNAYPVGIAGIFALVGSTDTFWVWDMTTSTWIDSGGGGSTGDMVLASAQTNSGLKTFLNATLGLRNVTNTITSLFANAATVARTWTFPDKDGTVAMTSDLTNGTVTSVAALTLGTTGTDLSSTVATGTTTPVITLQVPTASASNRGALSAADWSTFNGKQASGSYEVTTAKDATGGYVGLTLFKINFKNAANTFTNFFTNATTAARTYTFPDKDGTVAMTSDITGINSNTNTGDQTSIVGITGTLAQFNTAVTDADLARTDAANTFTDTQTFAQIICTNNAITASGNAATIPVTYQTNTVTNNSASTLTITLTTAGAVNRQKVEVLILDASAVAQTLTWVNTENSTVIVPATSNGSITLPLSVVFQYNNATTKWRCVGLA